MVVSRLDLGEDHQLDASRGPADGADGVTVLNGPPLGPAPPALDRPVGVPFHLDAVPFEDVLERYRAALGVQVRANWQAFELAGVDRRSEVTLDLPATTPADRVLALALDQIGGGFAELVWEWDGKVLTITTAEDLARHRVVALFDVRPLLEAQRAAALVAEGEQPPGYDELVERLIDLITTTVETDQWHRNGGTVAKILELNRQLVITAPPRTLREVSQLLGNLNGG